MFYDNLLRACEINKIKITNLITELKISSGNISKWKNGGVPKADTLIKLSQSLNVTTDYLLSLDDVPNRKKESPKSNLTDLEQELLEKFNHLLDIDKGRILDRMATIYESYSPEQKENVS